MAHAVKEILVVVEVGAGHKDVVAVSKVRQRIFKHCDMPLLPMLGQGGLYAWMQIRAQSDQLLDIQSGFALGLGDGDRHRRSKAKNREDRCAWIAINKCRDGKDISAVRNGGIVEDQLEN